MNIRELLFTIGGRIGRKSLCLVFLSVIIISICASVIQVVFGLDELVSVEGDVLVYNSSAIIFELVVRCINAFIVFAPTIKRLHDVDKSGWFMLLTPIPLVNLWVLYLLFFKKGTEGKNRFGNAPQN